MWPLWIVAASVFDSLHSTSRTRLAHTHAGTRKQSFGCFRSIQAERLLDLLLRSNGIFNRKRSAPLNRNRWSETPHGSHTQETGTHTHTMVANLTWMGFDSNQYLSLSPIPESHSCRLKCHCNLSEWNEKKLIAAARTQQNVFHAAKWISSRLRKKPVIFFQFRLAFISVHTCRNGRVPL